MAIKCAQNGKAMDFKTNVLINFRKIKVEILPKSSKNSLTSILWLLITT